MVRFLPLFIASLFVSSAFARPVAEADVVRAPAITIVALRQVVRAGDFQIRIPRAWSAPVLQGGELNAYAPDGVSGVTVRVVIDVDRYGGPYRLAESLAMKAGRVVASRRLGVVHSLRDDGGARWRGARVSFLGRDATGSVSVYRRGRVALVVHRQVGIDSPRGTERLVDRVAETARVSVEGRSIRAPRERNEI